MWRCSWLLVAGLAVSPTHADTELVALLAANPHAEEAQCAYTTTRVDEEGDQVEAFEGEWRLVSVNGEAPSEKALNAYADEAESRQERNHPASMDLESVIEPGTLKLEAVTEEGRRYSFAMRAEDEEDEDFLPYMNAQLWTSPDYRVTRFAMRNRQPVSPATGIRISNFEQEMQFGWLSDLGVPVLQTVKVKVDGRAFFVKKISQDRTIRFSDITCRADL